MLIGQIARRVGIRTSSIRYYESLGLIPAARRVNGRRLYDESIIARLNLIKFAQKAGLSLTEIDTLLNGFADSAQPNARWSQIAAPRLRDIDAQITQLEHMRSLLTATLDCQCASLEACADHVNPHE